MLNEQSLQGTAVVAGAGVMGSAIAALLASAGWQVHLLDMPGPPHAPSLPAETGLQRMLQRRPPLLTLPSLAANIHCGNMDEHLERAADADWVIEAVAEEAELKQRVLQRIAEAAGPHTLVSSNTSALSLQQMCQNCPQHFRRRFFGAHFLNPPRYLRLLEIAPVAETAMELLAGLRSFAEERLGLATVLVRDTPGFISTRLWIAHLMHTLHEAEKQGFTVEEVDALTGPALGRPRSATFRMADLVGLDVVAAVARSQQAALHEPEPFGSALALPQGMQKLLQAGHLGDKTGGGYTRRENGQLQTLDLQTGAYRPYSEPALEGYREWLEMPLAKRLQMLAPDTGRWQAFLHRLLFELGSYIRTTGAQMAESAAQIDYVMQRAFGWEIGPCQAATLLPHTANLPPLITEQNGKCFSIHFKSVQLEQEAENPQHISLQSLRTGGRIVLQTPAAALYDMGMETACLVFQTRMGAWNPELCDAVDSMRERAEQSFAALVIAGGSPHFSAGYNLKLLLEYAQADRFGEIDGLMQQIQNTFLQLMQADIPIVSATAGYILGGGCECTLHTRHVQAQQESFFGLPESLAGLVPCGGATARLLQRLAIDTLPAPLPVLERLLWLLLKGSRSTSAEEAREWGLMSQDDCITPNPERLLFDARRKARELADNKTPPAVPQQIWAAGSGALAMLRLSIHEWYLAGRLTAWQKQRAEALALLVCGGELPAPRFVPETHFSALERELLTDALRQPMVRQAVEHILNTGKPLQP